MNDFLRIEGLTVEYHSGSRRVHAVNDLDLQVGEGEALGFVGETGAGKTTTALSILRILPNPPAKVLSGKVFFKGKDLFTLSDREMRAIRGEEIAMIFQDPMTSLDPVKTVGDQICEMILLHEHCSKKEAWQVAVKACRDWISDNPDHEMDIVFAVLDPKIMELGKGVMGLGSTGW